MNDFFLGICGMSLVFFAYFFLACHLESSRRKARGRSPIRVLSQTRAVEDQMGRRSFIHLEKQMADFLSSHQFAASQDNSALFQHDRRQYWRFGVSE